MNLLYYNNLFSVSLQVRFQIAEKTANTLGFWMAEGIRLQCYPYGALPASGEGEGFCLLYLSTLYVVCVQNTDGLVVGGARSENRLV